MWSRTWRSEWPRVGIRVSRSGSAGTTCSGRGRCVTTSRSPCTGIEDRTRGDGDRAAGFSDQVHDPLATAAFQMNREMKRGGTLSVEPERTIVLLGSRGSTVLNGEVRTRLFGADYAKGRIVTGLAIADSQGMGSYSRRLPVARSPPVCPGCIPGSATRRPSASRPGPRPGTGPAR